MKAMTRLLALAVLLALWAVPARCQMEVHGADSSFRGDGMVILWAVLKGADEESSTVQVRLIHPLGGPRRFEAYGVEATDPFSGQGKWLVRGARLEAETSIKSPRSSFQEMTGRRFHFYASAADAQAGRAALVVYYLSVPDTSPEFLDQERLDEYFRGAAKRLQGK